MTKVRGGEDIFVVRDEGENWEERDISVVIIDSMNNPHDGGHNFCLDCTSILCHNASCDIVFRCGETQQCVHRVTMISSPTVACEFLTS